MFTSRNLFGYSLRGSFSKALTSEAELCQSGNDNNNKKAVSKIWKWHLMIILLCHIFLQSKSFYRMREWSSRYLSSARHCCQHCQEVKSSLSVTKIRKYKPSCNKKAEFEHVIERTRMDDQRRIDYTWLEGLGEASCRRGMWGRPANKESIWRQDGGKHVPGGGWRWAEACHWESTRCVTGTSSCFLDWGVRCDIWEHSVLCGGQSYLVNVEEGGAELAEASSLDRSLEGLVWNSMSEQLPLQQHCMHLNFSGLCEFTPLIAGPDVLVSVWETQHWRAMEESFRETGSFLRLLWIQDEVLEEMCDAGWVEAPDRAKAVGLLPWFSDTIMKCWPLWTSFSWPHGWCYCLLYIKIQLGSKRIIHMKALWKFLFPV